MQNECAATKYFRSTSAGNWSYVASDGFPRWAPGLSDSRDPGRGLGELLSHVVEFVNGCDSTGLPVRLGGLVMSPLGRPSWCPCR